MSKKPKRVRSRGKAAVHGLTDRTRRMSIRLGKTLARLHAWGLPDDTIAAHVMAAKTSLDRAVAGLLKLPADWKPASGTAGNVAIAEGARVELTARGVRHVDGGLSEEQARSLTVDTIVRGKFWVKTTGGVKIPLQRSHIQLKRDE